MWYPEWSWACTGEGAVGCVPLGRSRHPQKTLNWGWRASWSKILNLNLIPTHSDGGRVCPDGGGDGGSLGGDVAVAGGGGGGGGCGGGGGGSWGPWVGGFGVCGAGLEAH